MYRDAAGLAIRRRGRTSGSLQGECVGVEVLCEGNSAVGAEISGPALPRFTSGVAAARLEYSKEALHERQRQRVCVEISAFAFNMRVAACCAFCIRIRLPL
jgi:hypothetical protein